MGEPVLTPGLAGWLTVLLLPLSAALVLVSALLERSGPIRLRHWVERAGGRLLRLYEAPRRFEAFRFLLSLAARLAPLALAWVLWELFRGLAVNGAAGFTLAVSGVLLAALEWANRTLVEEYSEEALSLLTRPLRMLNALLWPLTWVLAKLVVPSLHDEEDDDDVEVSEDEIDAFIDVGLREGIFEPEEQELVRSVVDFGDTQVRSVMTPRVEVVSASVDSPVEELCQRFFDSKHARLPLYRDSIDHVVGILHIRDLFEAIHDGRDVDPEKVANAPLYVPESKPLRQLLEEMQSLHQQMAIVVDEYGGVAGLVTVEDLVEEIVGEISDEHEKTIEERIRLDEERWRLPGRAEVEELEEIFGVDSDEVPYETVSGLVCGELGYVPKAGEVFLWQGLEMTIEDADERRIVSVAVRRQVAQETTQK